MNRALLTLLCLIGLLAIAPTRAVRAQVQSDDQQRCIVRLNKDGSLVARQQGKENLRCLIAAGKGALPGPVAECLLADPKGKVGKKMAKTLSSESKHCGVAPDFAYESAPAANLAAQDAELALFGDLFGGDLESSIVDCASDKAACKCQRTVQRSAEKYATLVYKEFVRCKSNALREGRAPFDTGAASAADVEACVTDAATAGSIAADSAGKQGRAQGALDSLVEKKCSGIADPFPGECSGLTGQPLSACIASRAVCRVCEAINEADALALNCDALDDGSENQSCLNHAPRASTGCGQGTFLPGTHELTFMYDGLLRNYDVHIPAGYDDTKPAPLLLNLHPLVLGGDLHGIWTHTSQQNVKSEEAGFIVLQPDGTGDPASWNGGQQCCDPAHTDGIDDVGFIDALVQHTSLQVCIDERRVVSTGMSNGGYLSHRIACEHPERLAAIAPVVGSLSTELLCADGRGVPVLQISGSNDSLASRQQSVDTWVAVNQCTTSTTVSVNGALTCTTHDECKDGVEVTHCVVADAGHCAFTDANPVFVPGCVIEEDIVAQDLIWDFFQRWRLP